MNTPGNQQLLATSSKDFWLVFTVCLFTAVSPVNAQDGISKRIVSIVPAVTEMLFAIGAGDQVVGVSSFAGYPDEVN